MKILLNSIFTGEYGASDGNLPHEVIDFFRTDNGNSYIYITPYGTIAPHMCAEDLSSILLIRSVGNHLVEVIAKAQPPFKLYTQGAILNKSDRSIRQQNLSRQYKEDIIHDEITYADLKPKAIFQLSKTDNEIHITIQIDKLYLPKKQILLTNRENLSNGINVFYIPTTARLANQSMKKYFDDEVHDEREAYEALRKLVDFDELWTKLWIPPKLCRNSINEAINSIKKNIRFEKGQKQFENSLDSFASRIIKIIKQKEEIR